jgi:hypothetical protein
MPFNNEDFYEEDFDQDKLDDLMRYLIEDGYLLETGLDENGEALYQTTSKFSENFPDMFEEQISETNITIYELWMMGLLDVTVKEEINDWVVIVTDKTMNCDLSTLTQDQKNVILQLRYKTLYPKDDTI